MKDVKSIVVLTGAGISAESGIKTFRASDGLWEEHRIEDVATPEGFVANPDLVHRFYNQRRQPLLGNEVVPNRAHHALSLLEAGFTGRFLLVTQNIDNLHEQAGSQRVLHMHGEILKMRCGNTGRIFECKDDISTRDRCPCCADTGQLRPHIVWFGEMPLYMDEINRELENCDLFISIGTSGNVYPAAGFVEFANRVGARTLEVNLEESKTASAFDDGLYGKAGDVLPEWVEDFLADQ